MPNINGILDSVLADNKLNIIVIGATHERYESTLALTGHNFFSLQNGKSWDSSYARMPRNYFSLESIPIAFNYNLVLCHTSDERLNIAKELSSQLGIPLIRHCHTLPFSNEEIENFNHGTPDLNTFISKYSMDLWMPNRPSVVIEHGIDTSFWNNSSRNLNEVDDVCISVVNYWQSRDWACGWNLWRQCSRDLPVVVVGKNPGLSEPMSPFELKSAYLKSRVFLNTSLHSPVPMSLLEAMACGCAIVSTNSCMIPEIIEHGHNGFLANDADELNMYCKMLLSDHELANTMGLAAARTIQKKFNEANFINNWNHVLYGVIS